MSCPQEETVRAHSRLRRLAPRGPNKSRSAVSPIRALVSVAILFAVLGAVTGATSPAFTSAANDSSASALPTPIASSDSVGYGFTLLLGTSNGTDEDLAHFKANVNALVAHGQKWVRFGISGWDVAQNWGSGRPLRWDESKLKVYDRGIAYAREKGLTVYLVTADGDIGNETFAQYEATMRQYWTKLAQRFAPHVSVWQLYNEVDATRFGTNARIQSLDSTYLNELDSLLHIGRTAIKDASASTLVTTNASGWPVDNAMSVRWNTFFDEIADALDVVTVDVYPADNSKEISSLTKRLDKLHRRYRKPVIIAEVGLQTCPGCWTESEQGRYLSAAIKSISAADPLAVLVYQWSDSVNKTGRNTFGVVHENGTPKSGFNSIIRAMSTNP